MSAAGRTKAIVLAAVIAVACGGQIDPYSTGFDPDASTILLPKDVCGKVLGIPGGPVHLATTASIETACSRQASAVPDRSNTNVY
jgi:hypothetical protein